MGRARRSFGYANVAATVALVLSASGGALAATHYLISSTTQISPRVLKTLRGAEGPGGPSGSAGATGPTGPTGPTGALGPEGKRGERGEKGERGLAGPATLTRGERGEAGPPGEPGAQGERGEKGEKGEAGSAVAYAHITEDAAVPESKNFETAVVEELGYPEGGIFCISHLSIVPHNVVATLVSEEAGRLGGIRASTGNVAAEEAGCPAGTQISVETYEAELVRGSHDGVALEEEFAGQGFDISIN